jgi:hypothetical protein
MNRLRYDQIKEILEIKINEDIAGLIIKELKFLESLVKCKICNKIKHHKQLVDLEYVCSDLCGFCGICINTTKICIECFN